MNNSDENLKKLMFHSLVNIDFNEVAEFMSPADRKAFLNKFSEVDCLDEVNLAIIKQKEEPGKLFSKKSFERFLHTLRLFVGGRLMGYFEKTAKCPEVMAVHIKIEYMTLEEYKKL